MANYTMTMVPGQQGAKGPPSDMLPKGLKKKWHKGEERKVVYGYNDTMDLACILWVPKGDTVTSITIAI